MGRSFFGILILFTTLARAELPGNIDKNGFHVLREKEGIVLIDKPGLLKGQRILFVRRQPEIDDVEVVANGMVQKSNDKASVIKIDLDSLKKIPEKGDFAVLLGAPKIFTPPLEIKPNTELEIAQEKPIEPESGYIDLAMVNQNGRLNGQSSNQANSLKSTSYKMQGQSLEWYFDFLPNYGFTYRTIKGTVPVFSYNRTESPSSIDRTLLRLNFRTRRSPRKLRWTFFLENLTDEFKTANTDEYVLGSRYVSLGLGGRLAWEPGDILFSKPGWLGQPNILYVEGSIAPSLNATDLTVMRGSASPGSSRTEYSLGYTHVFYWSAIPVLKRWFVDLRYTVTDVKLSYSGTTKSEAGGFYIIPENGRYREISSGYQITFGLRFEDLVGRNFKPRN